MKKIISLLLVLVLVLGMATMFAACKDDEGEEVKVGDDGKIDGADGSKGSVYYLNFKPEADQAWQDLAKEYTEKTGVPVKVITAASGEYSATLTSEMAKDEAPTLFQCGNAQGLIDWGEYCLDLTNTQVYKEMTTDDFNLKDEDGAVKAIGYCYEAFGIIVNTKLLGEAGYTIDQITDYDSLKTIAEDIYARSEELGFTAFASAGLDGSSSWRFSGHLANMPLYYEFRDDNVTEQPATIKGTYLDNYRKIWDLYISTSAVAGNELSSATGDMSQAEFGTGKAVFWQQGTWEYANLVGDTYKMNADDLQMIPIYCGVEGEAEAGLCCGTENCWAVNAKADADDIQATLDFLYWVVTSESGTTMMAEQLGPIPFKNAKEPENVFFADANALVAAGNYTVTWAFNHTPNVDTWRAGVVSALTTYSADPTDENWEAVETAFVAGWEAQYKVQHGL